jgi:hypothetical protein
MHHNGRGQDGMLQVGFPAPHPSLAVQGCDTAGASGENDHLICNGRHGAGGPAVLILPHQLARVSVQSHSAAVSRREVDVGLHDRWRREERLGAAICPVEMLRKWRRIRNKTAILWGPSGLGPGVGRGAGEERVTGRAPSRAVRWVNMAAERQTRISSTGAPFLLRSLTFRGFPRRQIAATFGRSLWPRDRCGMCAPLVPMRMNRLGFVVGLGLLPTHRWWHGSSGLEGEESPSHTCSGR